MIVQRVVSMDSDNKNPRDIADWFLGVISFDRAVVRKGLHYGRDIYEVENVAKGYSFFLEPKAREQNTCEFTFDTRHVGKVIDLITAACEQKLTAQEETRKQEAREIAKQNRDAAIVSAVKTLLRKSQSILGANYVLNEPYTADSLIKICSDILTHKEKVTSNHNEICLDFSEDVEIKDKTNKGRLFVISHLKKEKFYRLFVFDANVQDVSNPNRKIEADFHSAISEFKTLPSLYNSAKQFDCERLGVEWLTAGHNSTYCDSILCSLRETCAMCTMYKKAQDYMSQLKQSKEKYVAH